MMTNRKRIAAALLVGVFSVGSAATAFAAPPDHKGKCNSGNGNNSEDTPETDCDPGGSGGHNNGGD